MAKDRPLTMAKVVGREPKLKAMKRKTARPRTRFESLSASGTRPVFKRKTS